MRTPKRHAEPRTGDTYYTVRYRNPPGGPQRSLSFWGATAEKDALQFCKLLEELGPGAAVDWWNNRIDNEDALTLDDWWRTYMTALTGVTDGTRHNRERIYQQVWAKPLGSKPLTGITRADIAAVVNDWSTRRSDTTVRNYYVILAGCLRVAVDDGLLTRMPARGIRLPRRTDHETTEMRFLTHAEWHRIREALTPHYRPLFTFLAGTGCRAGEAEALTVADVDLNLKVVRIVKAMKWDTNSANRAVGPTKTRKSRRTVTLPPEVVAELRPLVDGRPGDAPLFTGERGRALQHRKVWQAWKDAGEAAGLSPRPRVHDLRHTHVAWLIAAGVSLPVIQARLGHEHIETTIGTYGHLLPEMQVAAAAAASLAMTRPAELEG